MNPQGDLSPSSNQSAPRIWKKLDPMGIIIAPAALFLVWLIEVLVFTRARQPGIICMTPAIWLLAFVIGRGVLTFSSSREASSLAREAALAGGVFGVLTGILYALDILIVGNGEAGTPRFAAWSGILCILSGAGICALIAYGMVKLSARRKS
jgi:hypothetical protein